MTGREERLINYGEIKLLDISCESPYDWDETAATRVRVRLPSAIANVLEMRRRGFQFVDMILDVSVNLVRSLKDFSPMIRVKPSLVTDRAEDVRRIALSSFPHDRRFHLNVLPDEKLAGIVISAWVDELKEYYICEHKGEALGFLALDDCASGETAKKRAFVRLAAVDERYRASCAGLSLYANAAKECKDAGYASLDGCISTQNTPVMNLYSFLGASFSSPADIFLKEVC